MRLRIKINKPKLLSIMPMLITVVCLIIAGSVIVYQLSVCTTKSAVQQVQVKVIGTTEPEMANAPMKLESKHG